MLNKGVPEASRRKVVRIRETRGRVTAKDFAVCVSAAAATQLQSNAS